MQEAEYDNDTAIGSSIDSSSTDTSDSDEAPTTSTMSGHNNNNNTVRTRSEANDTTANVISKTTNRDATSVPDTALAEEGAIATTVVQSLATPSARTTSNSTMPTTANPGKASDAKRAAALLSARLGLSTHVDSVVVRKRALDKVAPEGELHNEIGKLVTGSADETTREKEEAATEQTPADDHDSVKSDSSDDSDARVSVQETSDNEEVQTEKTERDNVAHVTRHVTNELDDIILDDAIDAMEITYEDEEKQSVLSKCCCCRGGRKTS